MAFRDLVTLGFDLDQELDLEDSHEDDPTRKSRAQARNGAIFLVDVSNPEMFSSYPSPDGGLDECLYDIALQCIENFMKSKIISSEKDLVGVVFLGTEESNNSDFKNLYVVLNLEQPGAQSVLTVEQYRKDKGKLAVSRSFSFSDAFWLCNNMFSNFGSQSLQARQLFVFTCSEDPHSTSPQLRSACQQRGRDLSNNNIEIELLGLARPDGAFDSSVFWQSVVPPPPVGEHQSLMHDATCKIRELLSRINMKEFRSRALSSLTLDLFGTQVAVKVFSRVNVANKPTAVKLDRRTNEEVKTRSELLSTKTAQVLMPDEVLFSQTFAGDVIALSKFERQSLNCIAPKAIKVLGFRSLSKLKFTHYIRPAHFIYPDETSIQGSITVMQALLKACLSESKFAVCSVTARANAMPRMASLVPQEELRDQYGGCQIQPPGFHVIYRPYAEDVRDLTSQLKAGRPRADQSQVQAAEQIVDKLRVSYDPENFRNPYLARFYAYLEALALEREEIEEPEDLTNPSVAEVDARIGDAATAFKEALFPGGVPPQSQPAKRKQESSRSGPDAKKAASSEVDTAELRKAARENKLAKFTVVQLKSACELFQLPCAGRKQELIDRLMQELLN